MTTHVYMNRIMKGITVSSYPIQGAEEIGEMPFGWPFSEKGWSRQNYEPAMFLSELRKTTREMSRDSPMRKGAEEIISRLHDYFPGFNPEDKWSVIDIEPSMDNDEFYGLLLLSKGVQPPSLS